MTDILSRYDILGAFVVTLELTVLSALGALLIGTVVAVMRVSPVGVLRNAGAAYVNLVRNTPLTLILVFCVLGLLYIMQLSLADPQSPTSINDNTFRWAVIGLSVYHAAFVCEALRSGVNTVPAGQAEAAPALGLTFGPSQRPHGLPQPIPGAHPPHGAGVIALTKNTTVASIIGVAEASGLMREIIENETGGLPVFFVFALGFVILTLPVGVLFTSMSRRLAVKR